MAAVNRNTFVGSLYGALAPLLYTGKFQAGSTQAIKKGELLKLSSGNWVPLTADESMSAIVAVSNVELRAGDRAGYYEDALIVPRPGDVFELPMAASPTTTNPAPGHALYLTGTAQEVTTSVGTNIVGHVVSESQLPKQGHLSVDGSPDAGTTVRTVNPVRFTVKASTSYYAALQL